MNRDILRDRARLRGEATFQDMDVYGLTDEIIDRKTSFNDVHRNVVEQGIAIVDANIDFKLDQVERNADQKRYEIEQDQLIFDNKIDTMRAKLALKIAAEQYALAAKQYEAQVRKLISEAKLYAQQLEREYSIPYEEARADVAEQKQSSRLVQLQAEILTESVNRAQVEADVAKMKVDVAKAQVRVLQAQYEAAKAELDVINAELQVAMSEAEKATIRADVAMTYAEVVMKQLSTIKLDLESTEIAHGLQYIQTRLTSLLARQDIKVLEEREKAAGEADQLAALNELIAATQAQDLLEIDKILNEIAAIDYEIVRTLGWGLLGATKGNTWATATQMLMDTKFETWKAKLLADTASKQRIDLAETSAAKNTFLEEASSADTRKYIRKL